MCLMLTDVIYLIKPDFLSVIGHVKLLNLCAACQTLSKLMNDKICYTWSVFVNILVTCNVADPPHVIAKRACGFGEFILANFRIEFLRNHARKLTFLAVLHFLSSPRALM